MESANAALTTLQRRQVIGQSQHRQITVEKTAIVQRHIRALEAEEREAELPFDWLSG